MLRLSDKNHSYPELYVVLLVSKEAVIVTKTEKTNGNLAIKGRQEIIVIEASKQARTARFRVAAYCRVSSSSTDQMNSFAAQNRYYTALISGNESWELVD